MCIIIDANCCGDVVGQKEQFMPVLDWLRKGKGKIATGGKNLEELRRNGVFGRLLVQYEKASLVSRFSEERIMALVTKKLRPLITSDDEHVIGLVLASGSRLILTRDEALKNDLKNVKIVPKRSGTKARIYRDARDKKLLHSCPQCHSE